MAWGDVVSGRPAWMGRSACNPANQHLFFPTESGANHNGRAICTSCPVAGKCLEYALAMPTNPQGMWGGTSEKERRAIRKTRLTVRTAA